MQSGVVYGASYTTEKDMSMGRILPVLSTLIAVAAATFLLGLAYAVKADLLLTQIADGF
jgi:hypothetical protein